MKLLISPVIVIKVQPSTITKRISLNGKEIITGGNIIIPIAIKTEATIISITMNGKNIKIPILKATFNSVQNKRRNQT